MDIRKETVLKKDLNNCATFLDKLYISSPITYISVFSILLRSLININIVHINIFFENKSNKGKPKTTFSVKLRGEHW